MVDVPRHGPSAVRAVESLTGPSGPDYLFLTHVDDTADHGRWREEYPDLKRIFHSGDLGVHNWIGDSTLEGVEVLLRGGAGSGKSGGGLAAWDLDGTPRDAAAALPGLGGGEFLVLHTPGHSPGSISLLFRPVAPPPDASGDDLVSAPDGARVRYPRGVLFTGDTYAWTTRDGGRMSGYPRYGHDLAAQAETLRRIGDARREWDAIAPGHGHARFYLRRGGSGDGDEGGEGTKLEEMEVAIEELLSY